MAAGAVDQAKPRSAIWTRDRLGVKAPIAGVVIFARAQRAHRKPGHRREPAVVRSVANSRETRSAIGAVGEGVAIAAVGWIEDLAQAVGAGRGVGRDQGFAQTVMAAGD